MMNKLFSQLLAGACFAALAGTGLAQTDTTPPAQPSANAAASSSKAHATHSATSKHAQHHAHTKTATHKKSTSRSTKATAKTNASTAPTAPEDNAYRQALRGCAGEQNQAQRDSCLDSAIERFQRNT
jgi:hypothetical protein